MSGPLKQANGRRKCSRPGRQALHLLAVALQEFRAACQLAPAPDAALAKSNPPRTRALWQWHPHAAAAGPGSCLAKPRGTPVSHGIIARQIVQPLPLTDLNPNFSALKRPKRLVPF